MPAELVVWLEQAWRATLGWASRPAGWNVSVGVYHDVFTLAAAPGLTFGLGRQGPWSASTALADAVLDPQVPELLDEVASMARVVAGPVAVILQPDRRVATEIYEFLVVTHGDYAGSQERARRSCVPSVKWRKI